jgi:hypothetical protein
MRIANGKTGRTWLAALVLGHLAATFFHGGAHIGAHVEATALQSAFILLVIEIGPVAGLVLGFWRPAAGGWVVALTMAGAFVFGVANHFVIAGADRIDSVAGPWRLSFAVSAAALAVLEAAGAAGGAWYAMRRMEQSS